MTDALLTNLTFLAGIVSGMGLATLVVFVADALARRDVARQIERMKREATTRGGAA